MAADLSDTWDYKEKVGRQSAEIVFQSDWLEGAEFIQETLIWSFLVLKCLFCFISAFNGVFKIG